RWHRSTRAGGRGRKRGTGLTRPSSPVTLSGRLSVAPPRSSTSLRLTQPLLYLSARAPTTPDSAFMTWEFTSGARAYLAAARRRAGGRADGAAHTPAGRGHDRGHGLPVRTR